MILHPGYQIKYRPERKPLELAFSDLLDRPVFAVWKLEERNGKPTKVPCDPDGKPVSVREDWWPFEATWAAFVKGKFSGIGIKLGSGDEIGCLCGIDLDAKNGTQEAFMRDLTLIRDDYHFHKTFAEFSPSGRGAHIYFFARLSDGPYVNPTIILPHGTRMEVYAIKEAQRYFTVTGARVEGFGEKVAFCEEQLRWLMEEYPRKKSEAPFIEVALEGRKGPIAFEDLPQDLQNIILKLARKDSKFSYLFNRGFAEGAFVELPSQSEADFYFCCTLVGGLRKQMYPEDQIIHYTDLALRASRLYRPKWDERRGEKTYGLLTIEEALRRTSHPPIEVVPAENILTGKFDPPREVIKGLLVEGVTLCGGWPKSGKTWLALEASVCVGMGRPFLGRFDVEPGKVLYFSFEESETSLHARLKTLLGDDELPAGKLFFSFKLQPLTGGGVDQLSEYLAKVPGTSLVVLDPLIRARARKRRADGNIYEEDYETLEGLQNLAKDTHTAFLVIHHLRKMEAPDPILAVSGSTGLMAVADNLWVLKPAPAGITILHVRGRNIRQEEFALRFDGTGWTFLGDAVPYQLSPDLQTILAVLPSDFSITLKELAERAGMPEYQLSKKLRRLMDLNLVEQEGRGRYKSLCPAFGNPEGASRRG